MVVHVSMQAGGAKIENMKERIHMLVPALGVLRARMRGRTEADFYAELVHGSLELGEEVKKTG